MLAIADDGEAQDLVNDLTEHPDEPLLSSVGYPVHVEVAGTWRLEAVPSGAERRREETTG